jgi:predicted ATP-grasp superfamily ATP-dependent carboligase
MNAASVLNKPVVNKVVAGQTMTDSLKKEIERLRNQLEAEKKRNRNAENELMLKISDCETSFIRVEDTRRCRTR